MAFVRVCAIRDIKPGEGKQFVINSKIIAIFNVAGEFYCIGGRCTHAGGPLAQGMLEGYEIECPLHGARFDVRNGNNLCQPAPGPEPSYEVKIEGENIMVNI